MDTQERSKKIEQYGKGAEDLRKAIKHFPKEMWNYKPGPEHWCIIEILVHLADSEAHGYVRSRTIIVEPGKTLMAYDQEKWATELHYGDQDPELNLRLFLALRESNYKLLLKTSPMAWGNIVIHPERGPITLDDYLETYHSHVEGHIKQMERRFQEWKKKK